MIDPKRTVVIIAAYPDSMVPYKTSWYLEDKGIRLENTVVTDIKAPVTVLRNRIMRDYVSKNLQRYEWFVFLDKDVIPTQDTDPFWDDVPFDVVGCTYDFENNNRAWLTPESFHMGLVRVRSTMFPKLSPPWFQFQYSQDGCDVLTCECGSFRDKLLEAGATITRRGHANHDNSKHSWHRGA